MVPRVDLVEAQQQVDERGLAGAGRTDDRDGLTRCHVEIQVVDERGVGVVAERHVAQVDAAGDVGQLLGSYLIGLLLGFVEQLEDALCRGDRRLHHVGDARGLRDRPRELARVLDERLDVAQRHRSRGDPNATDDGDRDVVEVPDERGRRHDDSRDELRLEARVVELLVLLVELRDGLLLASEHLHDAVSGVHLLDVAVELAGALPLSSELLLRPFADDDGDHDRDRHREQRDRGEQRADPDHHREDADDGEHGGDDLCE